MDNRCRARSPERLKALHQRFELVTAHDTCRVESRAAASMSSVTTSSHTSAWLRVATRSIQRLLAPNSKPTAGACLVISSSPSMSRRLRDDGQADEVLAVRRLHVQDAQHLGCERSFGERNLADLPTDAPSEQGTRQAAAIAEVAPCHVREHADEEHQNRYATFIVVSRLHPCPNPTVTSISNRLTGPPQRTTRSR